MGIDTRQAPEVKANQDIAARLSQLSPAKRALLEQRLKQRSTASSPQSIPQRPPSASAPLSFSQERVWFLSTLDPAATYNRPLGLRLVGSLSIDKLRDSLNTIVRRHEILRSTFPLIDGQPMQIVGAPYELDLPVVDISGRSEAESRRIMQDFLWQPFDLSSGPLLRAALYRYSSEDHVLLLAMHHIVFDGWSSGIFVHELSVLYDADASQDNELIPLPVQYADFAVWQRQELDDTRLEPHLRYWKDQLGGEIPALQLPTDHARPAVLSNGGATQVLTLSPNLTEALKGLSRRLQATLFVALLAAVKVFLYRFTGQADMVVASPVAGRDHVELEGLIGYFINTLVLRSRLAPDMTFATLIEQVKATTLAAYDHQELPFERLIQELHPERDLSRPPLFQVMFNFENVPKPRITASGLTMTETLIDSGTTTLDLSIEAEERDQQLIWQFTYSTDLFEAATITRMMGHFHTLLESITADASEKISHLPLLTQSERHQLLVEWNATQTNYPDDLTVHAVFERYAQQTPDAAALSSLDQELTYAQLNEQANQLAHYLLSLGVTSETMVAVSLERSVDLIVSLLGILKAGCVYLPLDPAYPTDRLAFLLEDAQASIVIARQQFSNFSGTTIIPGENAEINQQPKANPALPVKPTDLAYMIYTSGSTGVPKGVLVEHHSLVNYIEVTKKTYGPPLGARMLLFSSSSFDASLTEIFTPLLGGGTLVIHPDIAVQSATDFLRLCSEMGVTVMVLPTSYWHEITINLTADHLPYLRDIKLIAVGGDRMLPEYVRMWQHKVGASPIITNGYGPTEATITVTLTVIGQAEANMQQVMIGRPIANSQFYLLDEQRQPVPIGVPGELYLGGVGLARGYWRRPELTASRFIAHPFSAEPGARLYRTGDLARYRADGAVEILGRVDRQLKIRGFRVELGEIEAALLRHPQVQAAIAIAQDDGQNKRIAAYVVSGDASLTTSDLRQFMERQLPKFMVPAAFVRLDVIPLTPGGKIDYQALPAPDFGQHTTFTAPRDKLEQTLVTVWEEVLGIQPIGIQDNFFEIGGHSLLAVRLFSRLETVLGQTVPLASLFQASTIEQLAALLRQGKPRSQLSCMVAIQPEGTRKPLFCLHPLNGGIFQYRNLIPYLGPDQPIYGLQARGMDGEAEPFTQLDEMVAHYVTEIRRVQPQGPYRLCGYSFGGRVALEVATELMAQGQAVDFLGVIADRLDANATRRRSRASAVQAASRKLGTVAFALQHLSAEHRRRYMRERIHAFQHMLAGKDQKTAGGQGKPDYEYGPSIEKVRAASAAMMKTYLPHAYYGPLTYFKPRDEIIHIPLLRTLKDIGKGPLTVIDINGTHWDVMEPQNIETLGKAMAHILKSLDNPVAAP